MSTLSPPHQETQDETLAYGRIYNELIRFLRRLQFRVLTARGDLGQTCWTAQRLASRRLRNSDIDLHAEVAAVTLRVRDTSLATGYDLANKTLSAESLAFVKKERERLVQYFSTFPAGERFAGFRELRIRWLSERFTAKRRRPQ